MPKQNAPTELDRVIVSIDAGNGGVKAVTNVRKEVTLFEPVIAPLTTKRHAGDGAKLPTHSLRIDGETFVFGLDDVQAHGQHALQRRLNASERYTTADYFKLIAVALLRSLAAYRGEGVVEPYIVLSLPIEQFQSDDVQAAIKDILTGKHEIVDVEGCTLRLNVKADRLLILPESFGALVDYAWDAEKRTIDPREVSGSTLVADVGYLTTDLSYYVGTAYQRDAASTIPNAGMGIVARQIAEWARTAHVARAADPTAIDRSMRQLAGKTGNKPLNVELVPGKAADVSSVYIPAVSNLAQTISAEILTRFTRDVTRLLLTGGGARHLKRYLMDALPFPIILSDDPELANVRGGLSYQIGKLERGGKR